MSGLYTRRYSFVLLLALLVLPLAACDSAEPEEDPPAFTVSSLPVQLADGSAGIQFFARPNKDVILTRVRIEPPTGEAFNFNAGSSTVIENESFALQGNNEAYFRLSGPWVFRFVGNLAGGGRAFEVSVTVNVSA